MTVELEQQLASVPLLAGLEPKVRHRLAEIGKRRTYSADEAIVREGTTGTALYILLTGRARVEQDGKQLGELSAGDFFGELALIEEHPRSATVIATDGDRLSPLPRLGVHRTARGASRGCAADPARADPAPPSQRAPRGLAPRGGAPRRSRGRPEAVVRERDRLARLVAGREDGGRGSRGAARVRPSLRKGREACEGRVLSPGDRARCRDRRAPGGRRRHRVRRPQLDRPLGVRRASHAGAESPHRTSSRRHGRPSTPRRAKPRARR